MIDKSAWGYSEGSPTNQDESIFEFDSTDLWECLEHYKETGEIEPLENAIAYNNGNKRRALAIVNELSEHYQTTDNNYLLNKLTNIKNLLR